MNILQPDDLLTLIRIPATWAGARFYFEKVRDRNVWDFPADERGLGDEGIGEQFERHPHCGECCRREAAAIESGGRRSPRQAANAATGEMAGKLAVQGAVPLQFNAYKIPLMRNLVKRAIGGVQEAVMGMHTNGPRVRWGQNVPIHIAWFLIWVAAIAGLVFLVVHAIYLVFAKDEEFAVAHPPDVASLARTGSAAFAGRAACFTGHGGLRCSRCCSPRFLPKVGIQFNWVVYHWIAGTVLTVSVLFHIIHASFFMDFWSIWPDSADLEDAWKRLQRFFGQVERRPRGDLPSIRSRTSSTMA